ncbi:MAG: LCP family protein [Clostridia bacterium]
MRRLMIKFLSVLIVFLLMGAGAVGGFTYMMLKDLQQDPTAAFKFLNERSRDLLVEVQDDSGNLVEKTYQFNKDVISMVFLGLDSNAKREQKGMGYRTDTIIVAAIDLVKKEATMISVPRDTRTMVKRLDSQGNVISQSYNKINAAYAFGPGRSEYSYRNSLDAISHLFGGVELDYYVGIDMDGIIPITDAVGGVTLTMDVSIPKYGLVKGEEVLLKGKKAHGYVRERHVPGTDGSDISRTQRQQRFVKAFLAKVKEMGPVDAVPRLYGQLAQYVETNLNLEQMAALALVLKDMDLDTIRTVSLPGSSQCINGVSYWIADEAEVRNLIAETFYKEKAIDE